MAGHISLKLYKGMLALPFLPQNTSNRMHNIIVRSVTEGEEEGGGGRGRRKGEEEEGWEGSNEMLGKI